MKKLGSKITHTKTQSGGLLINVSGAINKSQLQILTIWFVLWTVCGLAVVASLLFTPLSRDQRIFSIVYLAFWSYFEYKVYFALRWAKQGLEVIKIEDGKLSYSQEINRKGKVSTYEIEQIRNLRLVDLSGNPFQQAFYQSFWTVGGEALAFDYFGKEVRLGMKLDKTEASALKTLIQNKL